MKARLRTPSIGESLAQVLSGQVPALPTADPTPCAFCYQAKTVKDGDTLYAFCAKDLWLTSRIPQKELAEGKVARYFDLCPAYDGEE